MHPTSTILIALGALVQLAIAQDNSSTTEMDPYADPAHDPRNRE
jgi:hypothetical protein